MVFLWPFSAGRAESDSAATVATPWSATGESLTATDGESAAGVPSVDITPLRVVADTTQRSLRGTKWQGGESFRAAELGAQVGSALSITAFTAETDKHSVLGDVPEGLGNPFAPVADNTFTFQKDSLGGWSMADHAASSRLALVGGASSDRVDRQVAKFSSDGFSFSADFSDVGASFASPRSQAGKSALAAQEFGYTLGARRGTDRRVFSANWQPADGLGLSMTSEKLSGSGNAFEREQYGFESKNLNVSFSRLSIDALKSKSLGKELGAKLTKEMAARAKLGITGDALLSAKTASSLVGLNQEDYLLTANFGGGMNLVAEGNDLDLKQGRVTSRDEKLSLNRFTLQHRTREVSHDVNAKALTAMGHKALAKKVGHATEEWTANWQPSDALSLTHYRKEDVFNRSDDPQQASTTEVTRNNLAWQASDSLRLTAVHQTTEAGLKPGSGAATTTKSQTYTLAKSWGKDTALTLTRNTTDVRGKDSPIDSDQTRVQFRTANEGTYSFSADVDRRSHSKNGDSQATVAALSLTPTDRLGLGVSMNRKKSDAAGVDEKLRYRLAYDLGKERSLTANLSSTKKGKGAGLTETESLVVSLKPAKNLTLKLTDSDRTQRGVRSSSQQLRMDAQLGKSTSLTFRTDRSGAEGQQKIRTDTVLLTQSFGAHTVQLGRKSRKGQPGGSGSATFLSVSAQPLEGTTLNLKYSGRDDLKNPLASREWSFATQIGSVKLTGSQAFNAGKKGTKGDAILPFAKTYTPKNVKKYTLATALSSRWSMSAGYALTEDLKSHAGTREHSLSLFTANKSNTQIRLNFRRGSSMIAGQKKDYSVYEMTHSWILSDDRQVTLSARKIHGEGVKLFPGGKFEAEVAGQWSF